MTAPAQIDMWIKAPSEHQRLEFKEAKNQFDNHNLHWYYIFQRNWPAIEAAIRRDMGVFIISPSDKGGMLYDPPAKLVELCRPLHPMVFNDLFCLSRPEVHTLSIGASRPTDFDRHLETLPLLSKAAETLQPIEQRLCEAYESAIEPELRRPLELTVPPWEQTPGQVNITTILWLRNLAKAYDLTRYGKMRYNMLGNGGHWFPGMKADKLDGLDFSTVCADQKVAGRIRPLLEEAHAMLGGQEQKRLSQS